MRKLFGNSCAKGCMVYFVALVIIVVLTAMGLGGLKGKFSQDVQNSAPPASAYSTGDQSPGSVPVPQAPASTSNNPGAASAPQSVPPAQAPAQPAVQPTVQPSKPPIQIQVQTQGGAISAEASLPFYVVQPNDTLWSIAQGFNVQVDALRVINSLSGDLIKPGQLLYLPQVGQSQQPQPQSQQPSAPASAPAQQAPASQPSGDASEPTLPQTGINDKP